MEYKEVTSFINKAKKFGSRLDLTRIQKLCDLLDNPEKKCRFIHIAGTNGKGSTSVMIEQVLIAAGYKTGLFTSPFLYAFNERIQINHIPISDEALVCVMKQVVLATEQMLAEGFEHPTEFELITCAAFLYFAAKGCDVVVLEVGLGGRLDATNVIAQPEISVITSISFDHTEYLGNTLTEIAENKCGIIKEGCPVVSYLYQPKEVKNVILKTAKANKSLCVLPDDTTLSVRKQTLLGSCFQYQHEVYEISLAGEYQIYNAITAISAVEMLQKRGYQITREQLKQGLKTAKWPGRFEVLHQEPVVIADGSHNADGMRSFVSTAKAVLKGKKLICVFSMLKDKDYEASLRTLSEISDTVIVTEVEENPRTETAEKLENTAKLYFKTVYSKKKNRQAVQLAKQLAGQSHVIVALGSLYMQKNIKQAVEELFS